MIHDFEMFVTDSRASMIDALEKIDQNSKGFLVVLDDTEKVLGTLTDGDVRRAFIRGNSIHDTVNSIYTRNFQFIRISDNLLLAIDLFKDRHIKFLPVVDEQGKLQNIITKNQMHAFLLQDIHADLNYDFMSLDEGIVDYEIFQRPWGFYKTTVMNSYFQSKVISVKPLGQLSLQSHNHREEHWIVAHGTGTVQLDQSVIHIHCGSSVFIPKGCRHRLTNTDKNEFLIITEVQIGDCFSEEDIIRYEDIYGRV